MNKFICPISNEIVDQKTVRLTGALVVLSLLGFVITKNVWIAYALAADFFIRACTSKKFSPLSLLASKIASIVKLEKIAIDKAPKIFAARIGLAFTLMISAFASIGSPISIVLAIILIVFASLEAFFNFCFGCILYSYVILPLNR